MKIDKVRIKLTDDYGPRIVEVKTKKQTFNTPCRTINSSEARHKTGGVCWEPYKNPIFEYVKNYDLERVHILETKNGAMAEEVTKIKSLRKKWVDQTAIFYPRFKRGTKLDKDQIRTLLDVQLFSEFDFISIPDLYPSSNLSDFEKNVSKSRDYIESIGEFEAFPYIDMGIEDLELFKQKFKAVIDNNFQIVGLIHRSMLVNYPNYRYLADNNDNEIWIHTSGVGRYCCEWTASQLHLPQRFGIDTCTLDSRKGGGGGLPPPIEKVKRYDAHTLGMLIKEKHREKYGNDLMCKCPVCNGKDLDYFYNGYSKRRDGVKDPNKLRRFAIVHEAFSSNEEFERGREHIKEADFKDYLYSKEYINRIIKRIDEK